MVANADDPMVVWAATPPADPAQGHVPPHVTWFSAGQRWHDDSWVCPECGSTIQRSGEQWWCTGCPLRRPEPHWTVEDDGVLDPTGAWHKIQLQLPGKVNLGNAATALAVAAEFGVRPVDAVSRLGTVTSVAGRYAQVDRDGRNIRLLLAKNPAELAGGVRHGRRRADTAVHQRPRPRRAGHLLAVRRRLLPADAAGRC